MLGLLVSLILGGAAFASFLWLKRKWQDEALNAELIAIYQRAKSELPADDLLRLDSQIEEIGRLTSQAALEGVSHREASRAGKRAAIQQVAAFLEIERMFPQPQVGADSC